MEEQRKIMLDQIMTAEAKERLSRIGGSLGTMVPWHMTHPGASVLPPSLAAIVRAEKARAVEDMLLGAATSGRLQNKVGPTAEGSSQRCLTDRWPGVARQVSEEQLIQMLEQVRGGGCRGVVPAGWSSRELIFRLC
jgi:DNA-binding TFAR19-related protein (PDSD5 family)